MLMESNQSMSSEYVADLYGRTASGDSYIIRTTKVSEKDEGDTTELLKEARRFVFRGSYKFDSIILHIHNSTGSGSSSVISVLKDGEQVLYIPQKFHLDMELNKSTGKEDLCVYTDILPDRLMEQINNLNKQIECITKPDLTGIDYKWYHQFIFHESVPDEDIKTVMILLLTNNYVHVTICGRPFDELEQLEWDTRCKERYGVASQA